VVGKSIKTLIFYTKKRDVIELKFHPLIERDDLIFLDPLNTGDERKKICKDTQIKHLEQLHTPPITGTLSNHGNFSVLIKHNRIVGSLLGREHDINIPTSSNVTENTKLEINSAFEIDKDDKYYYQYIVEPWKNFVESIRDSESWMDINVVSFQAIYDAISQYKNAPLKFVVQFTNLTHEIMKNDTLDDFKKLVNDCAFNGTMQTTDSYTIAFGKEEETEGEDEEETMVPKDIDSIVEFFETQKINTITEKGNDIVMKHKIHLLRKEIEKVKKKGGLDMNEKLIKYNRDINRIINNFFISKKDPIEQMRQAEDRYEKSERIMYTVFDV